MSCPTEPEPVGTTGRDQLSKYVADALEATQCTYNLDSEFDTMVGAECGFPKCSATASASGSLGVSKSGCESISMLSEAFSSLQRVMECAMVNIQTDSTTNGQAVQTVKIKVKNADIAGDLVVHQSLVTRFNDNTAITNEFVVDMTTDVKTGLESMAAQASKVDSQLGTFGDSSKNFGSLSSAIEQLSQSTSFYDNITNIMNIYMFSQNVDIEVESSRIGGSIIVTQEMHAAVVVGKMMSNTIDSLFSTEMGASVKAQWRQTHDITSGGFAGIVDSWVSGITGVLMLGAIFLLVMVASGVRGLSFLTKYPKSIGMGLILVGLVTLVLGIVFESTLATIIGVLGLLVGMVYLYYFMKKARAPPENNGE